MQPRTRRGGRRWLTYDEVAEFAGCSALTVRNACQRGALGYKLIRWRRGNYLRRKRVILDTDMVSWMYARAPRDLLAQLAQLPPPGPPPST